MNQFTIEPIVWMNAPGMTAGTTEKSKNAGAVFGDVLQNVVADVIRTDRELQNKEYLLSTGQIDDPHSVPIAAAQAQLSVDLLVTLRTKALEAYNELMRLNI